MEATKAVVSAAPGLGLGAPSQIPIDFKIVSWKFPLQNENVLSRPVTLLVLFGMATKCNPKQLTLDTQ